MLLALCISLNAFRISFDIWITDLVLPSSCMYRHIHVQPCMLYQHGKYQSCIKELIVHSVPLLLLCVPQTPLPFPTGSGFRYRSSGLTVNLLYENLHFNHRAPGHWQTSSEWSGLLEDLTDFFSCMCYKQSFGRCQQKYMLQFQPRGIIAKVWQPGLNITLSLS